jgi:hypothetical protein
MRSKSSAKRSALPPLYDLYEKSVQSPETHIEWLVDMYHSLHGTYPVHLREDFCGTFAMCCAWVKKNRRNTAVGLDLDSDPIQYGKKTHLKKLNPEQQKRIKILQQNAISVTSPKADVIMAGNFSFYIFKERQVLLNYLRKARASLNDKGILFLEMAGGPGMISKSKDRRRIKFDEERPKKGAFTYIWDQQSFDPITHDTKYAIHFKMDDGRQIQNAFTYDWRLWTIPEVRDLMNEAGFSKVLVFWETSHKGKGTDEYVPMERGDNAYSWISYVVGVR